MGIAYLLTGSNLGNRQQHLSDALSSIGSLAGEVTAVSAVYESPAWGFEHPVPFLNQAIRVATELSPGEMMSTIAGIEEHMGRKRSGNGYEARNIDIDILLFDDLVLEERMLSIPHPRMHLRRFALVPLLDIDESLVHPGFRRSIRSLLHDCTDRSEPVRIKEPVNTGGGHAV